MFRRLGSAARRASKARLYSSAMAAAGGVPLVFVSGDPLDEPKGPHHKPGGGFVNPWKSFDQQNMTPSTMWNMYQDWEKHPVPPPDRLPPLTVPEFTPPPSLSPAQLEAWSGDIKATFLGHACFLVEFPKRANEDRGLRVLFDPVWSHRCSPSQIVGPARVAAPPIKLEDIPHVDAVVISHNHYDHLDIKTLKHLYKAQPAGSIHFFAPLGNKEWFLSNIRCRDQDVSELDWRETRHLTLRRGPGGDAGSEVLAAGDGDDDDARLRVTALECQHFTGRGIFDRNDSLWASWTVESSRGGKVWFAGDTGYKSIPRGVGIEDEHKYPHCPAFAEIGEREGPFDLSMIPIGAYDPRWFMSRVHCSPEDAVELHRETKSRRSLGMHHSTWMLTCEPMDEPPKRLRKACDRYGISEQEFGVSGLGETRRFKVEPRGTATAAAAVAASAE
ncbi:hypothetical protein JCM11491_002704 [Sporobolomyces phaffii]